MHEQITRHEVSPVPDVQLETEYVGIRRQRVTFSQKVLEQFMDNCLDGPMKRSLVQHKHWTRRFEWDEVDDKVVCQVSIEQIVEHRPGNAPAEADDAR